MCLQIFTLVQFFIFKLKKKKKNFLIKMIEKTLRYPNGQNFWFRNSIEVSPDMYGLVGADVACGKFNGYIK